MPPLLRRNSPDAAHDPTQPQIDRRASVRCLHRRLGVPRHIGLSGVSAGAALVCADRLFCRGGDGLDVSGHGDHSVDGEAG